MHRDHGDQSTPSKRTNNYSKYDRQTDRHGSIVKDYLVEDITPYIPLHQTGRRGTNKLNTLGRGNNASRRAHRKPSYSPNAPHLPMGQFRGIFPHTQWYGTVGCPDLRQAR